jgi:hypothetical protein
MSCVNIQILGEPTEMVTHTIVELCLIVAIVELVMKTAVDVHIVFLVTLVRNV